MSMDGNATTIQSAVSGLFDIAGDCLTMITGNPVLFTMFCAGLIFTGIGIINKIKR